MNSRQIIQQFIVMTLFCMGMVLCLPGQAQQQKPATQKPTTPSSSGTSQQSTAKSGSSSRQGVASKGTTSKQGTTARLSSTSSLNAQSIEKIKADIEKSTNGPLYVKTVLQKHFVIDTIVIRRTEHFMGLPDSLAYHGKVGKVYGPYGSKNNVLLQILAKSNNAFNHISQIFIDTAVFTFHTADSLANSIMQRLKDSTASFEYLAQAYSMGGEAATQGDLGWVAMGYMIPQIEKQLGMRKKGDVFKLWTKSGVHIIRKTDNAKEDTGYALMMRVFL